MWNECRWCTGCHIVFLGNVWCLMVRWWTKFDGSAYNGFERGSEVIWGQREACGVACSLCWVGVVSRTRGFVVTKGNGGKTKNDEQGGRVAKYSIATPG